MSGKDFMKKLRLLMLLFVAGCSSSGYVWDVRKWWLDYNNSYSITFYDNSEKKVNEEYEVGKPTKEGYKFLGWKLENFDVNNAMIIGNNQAYVKENYYNTSTKTWLKYIDAPQYINEHLKNVGEAGKTVKIIAQWEKL